MCGRMAGDRERGSVEDQLDGMEKARTDLENLKNGKEKLFQPIFKIP